MNQEDIVCLNQEDIICLSSFQKKKKRLQAWLPNNSSESVNETEFT
jgi:hypothetical protein